jgi:LemA protein
MLIVILLAVLAVGYFWYATIVTRGNKVREALSDIDVQLTKRHDLIPNILQIAERFMEHERSLMTDITRLRGQAQAGIGSRDSGAVDAHLQAESQLQGMMSHFFALAENYPQLKSDATMVQAQTTYNEVEEHIAAARRFYNAAVADLNNSVQVFPGTILAGMAGVSSYPFYVVTADIKAPIDASTYLKAGA